MYSRDELRRKAEKPKARPNAEPDLSEQALALCFVGRMKSTLRYVDKKGWMVWYPLVGGALVSCI